MSVHPKKKRKGPVCEQPWSRFLAAILVVMSLSVGCETNGSAAGIVECPVWTDAALGEFEEAIRTGRFPELEKQIGRQLTHCNSIEAALGNDPDCNPQSWSQWAALILSLECIPSD